MSRVMNQAISRTSNQWDFEARSYFGVCSLERQWGTSGTGSVNSSSVATSGTRFLAALRRVEANIHGRDLAAHALVERIQRA